MENMSSQLAFSRLNKNYSGLGYYPTPDEMAERIGRLLKFPEGDNYANVLEPSAGTYQAMNALIKGADAEKNVRTYGVELEEERARIASQNVNGVVVCADFLKGVYHSRRLFQFAGINPPYGTDVDNRHRLERLFMEETAPYLQAGGIYVAIIPHYVLTDWNGYLKPFLERFGPLSVYKFPEGYYEQFRQVVIIGKRKVQDSSENEQLSFSDFETQQTLKEQYAEFVDGISDIKKVPDLPENGTIEKIAVPSASSNKQIVLAKKEFDVAAAAQELKNPVSYKWAGKRIAQKEYEQVKIGTPVVDLSNSFLCLVASCVQEFAGENFVSRGGCRIQETEMIRKNPDGSSDRLIQRSQKVEIQVMDSYGNYTKLS